MIAATSRITMSETLQSAGRGEKYIPSTMNVQVQRPKNADELNKTMEDMDKINGTTFRNWILSEENIGYVCTFKRHLWENNWEESPESVIVVMQFLVKYGKWSVPSTAECILKMFIHFGIDSPRFGAIVNGIVKGLNSPDSLEPSQRQEDGWTKREISDLVYILLIDNTPKECATFLRHLSSRYTLTKGWNGVSDPMEGDASNTKSWSRQEILDVFQGVSHRAQWTEAFRRELLLEYSTLAISDAKKRREFDRDIRFKSASMLPVDAWSYFPPGMPPTANGAGPSNGARTRQSRQTFSDSVTNSLELLDTILLEAECEELGSLLFDLSQLEKSWEAAESRLDMFMKNQIPKSDSKMDIEEDIEEEEEEVKF